MFWHETVPQIGESEACVRHAIFALGSFSMHTNYGCLAQGAACDCKDCCGGLKYYNKAINTLHEQLQNRPCQQLVLLTCILFICIELIQGNCENVIALVRRGYSIFESLGSTERTDERNADSLSFILIQMFERLRMMSSLFGSPIQTSFFQKKCLVLPSTKSLLEARSKLFAIMNDGHAFQRQTAAIRRVAYVSKLETKRLYESQDALSIDLMNGKKISSTYLSQAMRTQIIAPRTKVKMRVR